MASIRCYHCKGTHESVREVRECATVPAASASVPAFTPRPEDGITDKQLNFLRKLIATKDISKMADEIPSDQPTLDGSKTDLELMPKRNASFLIDALMGLNDKPQIAEKVARQLPDVPAGYYAIDGTDGRETRFYRVDRPTQGHWAGRTFLKVQSSDDFWPVRNRDEVARVLCEIAVDSEAAMRRYGHEIGRCGMCNRVLTDDESRAAGIGPVCREK